MADISSMAIMKRLFARLISWASDPSDLGHKIENNGPNERLEELEFVSAVATLIIFAGIALEVVAIWWVPKGTPKNVVDTVGNCLIGLGLIVEYFCILRAITATGEANRESEKKVAEANARGAEAERRAATAHARASASLAIASTARDNAFRLRKELTEANTRLAEATQRAAETERKTTELQVKLRASLGPRTPNKDKFLEALKDAPKPQIVEVFWADGTDCDWLATWITAFLTTAGWPVRGFATRIPDSLNTGSGLHQAQWVGGQQWGVTIVCKKLDSDGPFGPCGALLRALMSSLVDEPIAAMRGNVVDGVIRVVVAPRP